MSDEIRKLLLSLHDQENELNKELTGMEKQIVSLKKRKLKLAKKISKNMKLRNKLINQL